MNEQILTMNAVDQIVLRKQYLSDAEHCYRILDGLSIEHFIILLQSVESMVRISLSGDFAEFK